MSSGEEAELAQFASLAAHEMRSPIAVILGFAKLLERSHGDVLDESGKEFVGWIVDGAARLNELVEDMLAYARVGTGDSPLTAVILDELVRDLVGSLQRRDAQVTWKSLPTVVGDQHQLGQVLQNLVNNSCKFVAAGVVPVIHISADRRDDGWCITVSDNGIGIDPDAREVVFDIFSRLNGRERYDGTGVGLAICRRIIDGYGGRIWVEGNPGGGSRFRFTIPDRLPQEARTPAPRAGAGDGPADLPPPEPASMTDPLTGLTSPIGLKYQLARSLTRVARTQDPVVLVWLKIGGVSGVRDRLTKAEADEVAVEMGRRLRRLVRPPDTVGRMSTLEFAVLCVGGASPQNALALQQRLIAAVALPVAVGARSEEFVAQVSVVIDTDGSTAEELVVRAAGAFRA
jgi:diguanylate cyclase (GGDEF)-like protein